jgi:hypothetical protein
VLLDGLLEEPEFLVEGELVLLPTEGIVITNALEELASIAIGSKKNLSSFLPLDLVGIALADLFSAVPKKVEEGLENLGHLNNMILAEG